MCSLLLQPRRAVSCSEELVLSDGGFGATFAVEEDTENGIDPVALFVNSAWSMSEYVTARSNLPIESNHKDLMLSDNSSTAEFAIEEDKIDSLLLFVNSGSNLNAESNLLPMESNHDPGTVYPLNLGMYACG